MGGDTAGEGPAVLLPEARVFLSYRSASRRKNVLVWSMGSVLAYFLIGCGTAGIAVLNAGAVPLRGSVHGGQQALIGASLQLYAAGTSGDGSASTALLSQPVKTDSTGAFAISGQYSCPSAASQVYLVATGGSASATARANPAISLMTALGECGGLAASSQIAVNEATTVASVWPLAAFMQSATEVGSAVSDAPQFVAAVGDASELVNMQTGASPGATLEQSNVVPVAKLYSLANTLGACVNSAGGTVGDGSACGQLFASATPAGGAPPADTLTAALEIARNPARNVDAIYNLSPAVEMFAPVLPSAPADWTLPILSPPAAPLISPGGGTYASTPVISLSDATAGAAIYYTVDGTAPSLNSTPYAGPIEMASTGVLRAISFREGIESPLSAASFTVNASSLELFPAAAALAPAQTQSFTLSGASNGGVSWSLSPAVGSISPDGVYTAPASLSSAPSVIITARSTSNPSLIASAEVNLLSQDVLPPHLPSSTYYVDNANGSDSNSGTSPSSAFATVGKINAMKLQGGQTVAFKAGDEWHEQLNVTQSGAAGAPITYTSYGNGAQPILNASDAVSGWSQGSGVAAQETCAAPALCSGFEASSLQDWTGSSNYGDTTVTVSTAQSHHGMSSLALSSSAGADTRGWVTRSIAPVGNNSTLALRWYFLAPSGSLRANNSIRTMCLMSGGKQVGFATLGTDSLGNPTTIDFYDTANSIRVLDATPLAGFILGGWNEIEIDIAVSSTAGGGTLYLNGKKLSQLNNVDTHTEAGIDTVELGNMAYGSGLQAGGTVYFDDFKMSNAANTGPFSAGIPSNVWYHAQASDPRLINFNGQSGSPTYAVDGITGPNQFYWDGSKLYVYAPSNPAATVDVPQRGYALWSSGASYIAVSGLELRGAQQSDLYCTNTCSNWSVTNNTINASYSTALFFEVDGDSSVAGISILNNKVKGGGAGGIQINNGLGLVNIVGNEVWDFAKIFNPAYGTQNAYADGIEMYSQDGKQGFAYVAYNYIHDGGVGSSDSYGGGIHADTVAGMDIEHNTIMNTTSSGISLEKGSGSIARYNTIVHAGTYAYSAGLYIRAGEGWSSNNQLAEYNTIDGGWWSCVLGLTQDGPPVTATNITIRKNICVNAAAGTEFNGDYGANGSGNVVLGNSFGTPGHSFIYYNGITVSSYAEFDAAAGYATGSIQGVPQFVDPGNGNYNLQSTSPVVGVGAAP